MNVRLQILLHKPRKSVWRAFDNPENIARWQPTLISFTQISGSAGQAGAVSKLVYKENRRLIEITETITLRAEPEMFAGKYESTFAITYIDNHFIAQDNDTTLWMMNSDFHFKGLWKILSLLMIGSIRKRTENDMMCFKTLLENQQLSI